ncbi:PDR/VanB family oxidoreductase [Comamonas sp. lk]|uniref:PDR/VanB family oxidoreductase n=1 Tax=Comamonas sp. lk TaxID=2201272 RepID=UPI000EB1E714|nr:PDR/VanB family oxidoreductase [Comamonas sp. lk]
MQSSSHSSPTPDTLVLELTAAQALTPEVRRLQLRRPDGQRLPAFTAGAHIRVHIPGAGAEPTRCYSLVNSDGDGLIYEIAVKRECAGRGGSQFMHQLAIGQQILVTPPKNDFALHKPPHEALLIAGGIGITPILSMTRHLQATNRPYALHYGARSAAFMPYLQEIEALAGSRAQLYFDDGNPSRGMPLASLLGAPKTSRHVYVCGPRALIDATLAQALHLGWPRSQIHFELFSAPATTAADRGTTIDLARSGRQIDVPAGTSMLDGLIAAGCDPLFDCRRGECGMCAVHMLDGEVEHRDYALSDEQHSEGLVCICVARARSNRITLDL